MSNKQQPLENIVGIVGNTLKSCGQAIAEVMDYVPGVKRAGLAAGMGAFLLYASPAFAEEQTEPKQEEITPEETVQKKTAPEETTPKERTVIIPVPPPPQVSVPGSDQTTDRIAVPEPTLPPVIPPEENTQQKETSSKPADGVQRVLTFRAREYNGSKKEAAFNSLGLGAGASILCFGMYQDGVECSLQPSFRLSYHNGNSENGLSLAITAAPILPLSKGDATWVAGYSEWERNIVESDVDAYGFSDVTETASRQRDKGTYASRVALEVMAKVFSAHGFNFSAGGDLGFFTRSVDEVVQTMLSGATKYKGDKIYSWTGENEVTSTTLAEGLQVAATGLAKIRVAYNNQHLALGLPGQLGLDLGYGFALNDLDILNAGQQGHEVYEIGLTLTVLAP